MAGDEAEAWLAAWHEGMRRRGFPRAKLILWKQSYCYVCDTEPWFVTGIPSTSCSDDGDAVFLSIEHLRPPSVRPRPSLRKLLKARRKSGNRPPATDRRKEEL